MGLNKQKSLQTFVLIIFWGLLTSPGVALSAPIRIGALLGLTGEHAQTGTAFREGMEIAAEEINQKGGIRGQPLEIIFEDTQYNPLLVATESQKLLKIDRIVGAVIASYSEAMVAGPIFEKAEVPLISLWDSSPELDKLGDYIFGIGVWAPSTSQEAVRFVTEKFKAKTAVTLCTSEEWSLSIENSFSQSFKDNGGKILERFEVGPKELDFRTILLKIKNINPDVLYVSLTDNLPSFWGQYGAIKFEKPTITADVLNQEILNIVGGAAEGVYQTQVADPEFKSTSELQRLYQAKFKKEATQIFLTSLGYDSVNMLAKSAEEHGVDSKKVKEGLYSIKKFPGAAGETTINAQGSAQKMVSMFRVLNGKLMVEGTP